VRFSLYVDDSMNELLRGIGGREYISQSLLPVFDLEQTCGRDGYNEPQDNPLMMTARIEKEDLSTCIDFECNASSSSQDRAGGLYNIKPNTISPFAEGVPLDWFLNADGPWAPQQC
jgi:hypothetical protein